MLFNSYEFIFVYLPITIILFFAIAKYFDTKKAMVWLVVMSFAFYAYWDVRYIVLLITSITCNYLIGDYIYKYCKYRKVMLLIGIVFNISLLMYYKYMSFFIDNINTISGLDYEIPSIILPLGISFFTFTQTGYLVDIYRRDAKNGSFLSYCEFVTIFPHLIAGPIISYKEMLPQFIDKNTFKINYNNLSSGIILFLMGLFKKVIIADNLAIWATDVFSRSLNITMIEAWIGVISYTLQLYFDFSGYSEMAIGLGLMLNMKFPINFNSPYQACSIIDFWRRWHMTLGKWVREYIYIPLGGNRKGELCKMRNLLLSMLLVGFWHGAGWTFVIWGGIHGCSLVVNHQWRRLNIELPKFINWGITFLVVVIGWIFFRADNISSAVNIISSMVDINNVGIPSKYMTDILPLGMFADWKLTTQMHQIFIWLIVALIVSARCKNPILLYPKIKHNVITSVVAFIMFMFILYGMSADSEFLYFQF